MSDPVEEATPVPRKRRRWIVVGAGALLLLLIAAWWFGANTSVATRARLLRVGQSRDEVIRLMGQPQLFSTTVGGSPTEGYSDMTVIELSIRVLIEQYLWFDTLQVDQSFPVEIEYDADRRVSRVRIRESSDR